MFFFLFALFASLDATEDPMATMLNDPSTLVDGKVNAITGEPCLAETDLLIQGAEPIRIYRTYVSTMDSHKKKRWDWVVNSSFASYEKDDTKYRCIIAEKNGCPIVFKKAHPFSVNGTKYFRLDPSELNKGFSNTCYGMPSARTHLQNDYLIIEGESTHPSDVKFVTYHAANGSVREYKKVHDPNNPDERQLRLLSEHLPNGRWLIYDYEETTEAPSSWLKSVFGGGSERPRFWLKSIRAMNPAKTKVLATADFVYENRNESSLQYYILGSDGQTVQYTNYGGRLGQISLNGKIQSLSYIDCWDVMQQSAVYFPNFRSWILDYYRNEKEKFSGFVVKMDDKKDPRRCRVKTIAAPVGENELPLVTHSFLYDLDRETGKGDYDDQVTEVYDIEGNKTEYRSRKDHRLYQVNRFDKQGKFLNADKFSWGGKDSSYLRFKTFLDENKKSVLSKGYVYDDRGNVLQERLYGNLSGHGCEIALDANKHPIENGVEIYTKKFTYTTLENLLLQEEEPSGKRTVYSYLAGTDLPTARLIYDKTQLKLRTFFEYDGDHVLVREIHDDGNSPDPNNLSGVRVRTIRQTTPYRDGPYYGMPQIIEETFWEHGREHLLKKTVLTYTTGGRIAQEDIYDANGTFRYSLKHSYDPHGNLIGQTNALGQTKRASYDENGNCTETRDISGRIQCTMKYDFSNRPTAIECTGDDGIRRKSTCLYTKKHQVAQEVDFHGEATTHTYDPLGRRTQSHLPKLPTEHGQLKTPIVQKTYDYAGNETTHIDAEGHATTKTFNAYGKPVRVVHPDGAEEKYSYNLDGTLRTYTDSRGVQTSYVYDFLGRMVEKTVADATEHFEYYGNVLVSKTDAEGNRTVYQYDGAGRKISEKFAGETVFYEYDSLGRLHKTQTGDLVSVVEHDLLDRSTEERQESSSERIFRKTGYEYDTAGNRSCIIRFVGDKQTREEFRFDSLHRLIEKTDALGNQETISYEDQFTNPFSQKVLRKTHTDPLGLQTIETFDSHNQVAVTEKRKNNILSLEEKWRNQNGLLISQADTIFAPDGSSRKVWTTWEHDSRGRLSALTEAAGTVDAKITRYKYFPRGEVAQVTKPDGTVLMYEYNDLGFLTDVRSSDRTVHHTMSRNRLGHLLQSDGFARKIDPKGRVLTETFHGKYSLENRYDATGKRFECKIPAANCLIEYEYNPFDLKRVSRKTVGGQLLYAHTYGTRDFSGNLLEETLIGNLGTVRYDIDELSRKTSTTAPQFKQEIRVFDQAGNIRHMCTQGEDSKYEYDALYQLTSESGRFTHTYAYDSLQNRLQKDNNTYNVNDLQQLTPHMHYTKNGNPDRVGDTQYAYDALDRLIAIYTPRFTQTFSYDCENRCLTKTTVQQNGSETRYFLYDGKNEVGAFDERFKPVELRVLGHAPHAEIGAAVGIELGGEVFAPVHDLQGNVAALLALDTDESTFFRYSAFGEYTVVGRTVAMPWKFSSKRTDDLSGLVYYGRRFYMPSLGRWLTPDPAGFIDGMNLYAFVHNDPLTCFDEYGLFTPAPELPWQAQMHHIKYAMKPVDIELTMGRGNYDPKLAPQYYIDGIWNSPKSCIKNAEVSLQTQGNAAAIIPIHSESFGYMKDFVSVFFAESNPKYTSFASQRIARNLAWDIGCMDAMNDPRKLFQVVHSRGATAIYHAVKDFTPQQKDRLIIFSLGGIMILPRNLGFKVTNLIAEKDAYSLFFHRGLRKDPHKYDSFADVHILPQEGGFFHNFTSHGFTTDTYQQGIRDFVIPEYNKWGKLK